MENALKALVVIVVIFIAAKFVTSRQKVSADAAAVAAQSGNAVGFQPIPSPYSLANGPVQIAVGHNAKPADVSRGDDLAAALKKDGIPCARCEYLALSSKLPPTDAESVNVHNMIVGGQPLVAVNGKFCNNPSLAQVEAEYGRHH